MKKWKEDLPPDYKYLVKSKLHPLLQDTTAKQELFIRYYCETLNATQAVIMAKYKTKFPSQVGYANLKRPKIAARIQARLFGRLDW